MEKDQTSFQKVEELARMLFKKTGIRTKMDVFPGGAIGAGELTALMDAQEGIFLADLYSGDTVCWETAIDYGMFLIEDPYVYNRATGETHYGSGVITIINKETKQVVVDTPVDASARVEGATFGGSLQFFSVTQGIPVSFAIKRSDGTIDEYLTGRVEHFGVLKQRSGEI